MSKYKAGLHKDVSAIFNGVSLPKSDAAQRSSADPAPGPQGYNAPKPSVPEPSPQKLPVSQPPPVQKSSASGPLTQKLPVLQPPVRKPSVSQSPAQKPPASQPPTQQLSASQPPAQKLPVSQQPTQKPSVSEPPTQKLPVSQQPTQKPSVSEPPTQKLSASQPPVQKPSVSQPPTAQPPTQKPLVSEASAPKSPVSESPAQKSPALSNVTPAKPKTQPPPPQSQSKEAPAKQPKADAAAKTAGQAQWQRKLEQIKSKLFKPQEGGSATKQKVMVIAMPVLFIVLIFVFIRVFSAPSQKVTGQGKAGQANVAASSDRKVDWHAPKPYPTTLRDPMQFGPARGQAGGAGGLVVKGIVYSEDNPTAVIGDEVVHQGDKISDVVVTKINENSVEFEANGKKWTQNVQR